jgi:membrane protease YdiL (CAAX protease family)
VILAWPSANKVGGAVFVPYADVALGDVASRNGMFGLAITMALFAFFWSARDRLNVMGLEYICWRRTSARWIVLGALSGGGAGAACAWCFRQYELGNNPPFPELLVALTWGPLFEEVIFRGYLFSFFDMVLKRWIHRPGGLIVVGTAVVFAVSHFAKSGITPAQIGSVFITGLLYGCLRMASRSTVPPVCSHIAYNSVILFAAALFRAAT